MIEVRDKQKQLAALKSADQSHRAKSLPGFKGE